MISGDPHARSVQHDRPQQGLPAGVPANFTGGHSVEGDAGGAGVHLLHGEANLAHDIPLQRDVFGVGGANRVTADHGKFVVGQYAVLRAAQRDAGASQPAEPAVANFEVAGALFERDAAGAVVSPVRPEAAGV